MPKPEALTALETLAVAKAVKDAAEKVASAATDTGTHAVDVTVRITGTITKGEPTERTPTTSIPMLAAVALFLRRSGVTGEGSLDVLCQCIEETLVLGDDARETILAETGVRDAEAKVKARLAALPKVPVAGAVKAALMVTRIGGAADE